MVARIIIKGSNSFYNQKLEVAGITEGDPITSIGFEGDAHQYFIDEENYAPETVAQITDFSFPDLQQIKIHATNQTYPYVTSISFPELSTIDYSEFSQYSTPPVFFPNLNISYNDLIIPNITHMEPLFKGSAIVSIDSENLTSIASKAFEGCEKLVSVNLPNVTELGTRVFKDCKNLTDVDIPHMTEIPDYMFDNCTSLNDGLNIDHSKITSIGNYSFSSNNALTTVSYPLLETTGGWSYSYCKSIKSVSLPMATSIGSCTFYETDSLKELTLSSFKTGSKEALEGLHVTKLNLPILETIPNDSCLARQRKLNKLSIPTLKSATGQYVFYVSSIKEVNLPSIRETGYDAFSSDELEKVYMPNLRTTKGASFSYNDELESIYLPNLKSMRGYEFGSCDNLRIVNLPKLETAPEDNNSLSGCPSLEEVYMPRLKNGTTYMFSGCKNLKKVCIPSVTSIKADFFINLIPTTTCYIDLNGCTGFVNNSGISTTAPFHFWISNNMQSFDLDVTDNITIWTNFSNAEEGSILESKLNGGTIVYGKTHEEFLDEFFDGYRIIDETNENATSIGDSYDSIKYLMSDDDYSANGKTITEMRRDELFSMTVNDNNQIYNNVTSIYFPKLATYTGDIHSSDTAQIFPNITGLTDENLPMVQVFDRYAFMNCTHLIDVNLTSLRAIMNSSLKGCTSLTNVQLPNLETVGDFAFYNCNQVEQLKLPSVLYVGQEAFYNMSNLQDLNLSKVQRVCTNALQGCSNLRTVQLPSMPVLEDIGNTPFTSNVQTVFDFDGLRVWNTNIDFGSTSANKIFWISKKLLSMKGQTSALPSNVTIFTDFANAEEGAELEAHKGNATIWYAQLHTTFGFDYLEDFHDVSQATSIGYEGDEYQFLMEEDDYKQLKYPNLERLNIHDDSTMSFSNVTNAEDISFPKLITIDNQNTGYNSTVGNMGLQKLTELTGESFPVLENLGKYSFVWSNSITRIDLPNLKTLGDSVFWMTPISEVNLPKLETAEDLAGLKNVIKLILPSLKTIGDFAFERCEKCQSIILLKLTKLSRRCFEHCYKLKRISIPSVETITINDVFDEIESTNSVAIDLDGLKRWEANSEFDTKTPSFNVWISNKLVYMSGQTTALPSNMTIWTDFADATEGAVLEENKGNAMVIYGKTHEEFIQTFFEGGGGNS